jgi:glucosamine-6-phosphate deaminase
VHVEIRGSAQAATHDAAALLARWIEEAPAQRLMVAGGRTPLALYEAIAQRGLPTGRLHIEVLDEYVGVPPSDPRTCTHLLERSVAHAWRVPPERFFGLSSDERDALAVVSAHEQRIREAGGLDSIVLGLGKNGHLGFNEPGSAVDCAARVLDLDSVSIEANREWFGGDYAPRQGATVGLRTILGARRVLLLAFGAAKADAVRDMVQGPRSSSCPASFLQDHQDAHVFVDESAARLSAAR